MYMYTHTLSDETILLDLFEIKSDVILHFDGF